MSSLKSAEARGGAFPTDVGKAEIIPFEPDPGNAGVGNRAEADLWKDNLCPPYFSPTGLPPC